MSIALVDVDLDADHIDALAESDHSPDETVRRALTLYRELDDADELLRECDLLDGGLDHD